MDLQSIYGVPGALWQKCGPDALLCKVVRSNISWSWYRGCAVRLHPKYGQKWKIWNFISRCNCLAEIDAGWECTRPFWWARHLPFAIFFLLANISNIFFVHQSKSLITLRCCFYRQVKELLMRYVQDISACDLLDKLLILNPARRINANDALMHDFFWIDPMPSDLSKMLARHDRSMFEFLAPRKPGQKPVPQKSVVQPTSTAKPLMETGYHDRIFW